MAGQWRPRPLETPLTFGTAISSGASNVTNFSGRSSRSAFWWWYLLLFILSIIVERIVAAILGSMVADGMTVAGLRLWSWLVAVIFQMLTILWILPSTQGDNQYGPKPAEEIVGTRADPGSVAALETPADAFWVGIKVRIHELELQLAAPTTGRGPGSHDEHCDQHIRVNILAGWTRHPSSKRHARERASLRPCWRMRPERHSRLCLHTSPVRNPSQCAHLTGSSVQPARH